MSEVSQTRPDSRPAQRSPAAAEVPIGDIGGAVAPAVVYPTAFLEGAAVIVVEIAGARALAPFFGTSLQVWTAQITVTLLFLALGYGLGGLLARRIRPWTLAALFGVAGLWLVCYPLMRTPLLDFASSRLGVAMGSLLSAALLFGVPLLMLGAVSPVLIAYIDRRRPGAGSAAGRLFFTNTMGGLVGGWVTAFVLIPHSSLRWSLMSCGLGLLLLALLWVLLTRSRAVSAIGAMLAIAAAVFILHQPSRAFVDRHGTSFELRHSAQSGIGLLQVLDYPYSRQMLINGVVQSEMDRATGRSVRSDSRLDYIHNLHLVSHSHHPRAATALQLGLGAGLLPKELALRGVKVTAVEIEPQMLALARAHFDLPGEIDVRIADGRSFLRRDGTKYDLIFLDTFASESTAWYLLTTEAFAEMKQRLNPGGRLVINTVAYADPKKPGLERVEATLRAVFPEALVYPEPIGAEAIESDPEQLINATLVAGERLEAQMVLPDASYRMTSLAQLLSTARPAGAESVAMTDDRSDLDYAQAPLRVRWRTLIWNALESNLLWD